MTAKEYLQQYRESLDRTNELTAQLDELKAEAERLRDHEGRRIKLDAAVAKYVDACEDAGVYLEMLAAKRVEICAVIESVSDVRLRALLRNRYVLGYTWERIAVEMNYSFVHVVHRLHPAALRAVQEILRQS